MPIPYSDKIINGSKRIEDIGGWISEKGEVFDNNCYKRHDQNPCVVLFMEWIPYKYYRDESNSSKYYKLVNKKSTLDRLHSLHTSRVASIRKKYMDNELVSNQEKMELEMIKFFINCYSSDDFFKAFGREIYILKEEEHNDIIINSGKYDKYMENENVLEFYLDYEYLKYKTQSLLSHFKDVVVQYLHYDSIETMLKNTVRTTAYNYNERFYNNSIMGDLNIVVVPRMVWNDVKKRYEEDNILNYYYSDREDRTKKEVKAIKRLVSKDKINNYYKN